MKSRAPKDAIEVADKYRQKAVEFITNNPAEFVELAVWKFVKFWSVIYNPVGGNYSYGSAFLRQAVNFIAFVPLLALLPFGLWQLWKRPDKRPVALLLLGMISFYTAAHMVAMGYTRLRLPIDPILMLLAGIALSALVEKWQNKTT